MKKLVYPILLFITLILSACSSRESEMDRFVKDLMGKMTVEEKIGQLNLPVTGDIVTGQLKSSDVSNRVRAGEVGGLFNLKGTESIRAIQKIAVEESRLGIPLLIGMDVIHGYETVFPIPLGLSCSWDMDAVEKMAEISGIEAGSDGIAWTFSPMVDVARDPRWGRVSEGAGEDPYLVSQFSKAMVRGYRNAGILPCVKHFALYGAAEGGRDYNTVDMSRSRMYNVYLPPFKAAVEEGAGSFMASFNEIDGVPATANKWLLTEVLRNQWGFDGFVVSDYTGILEMVDHGIGNFEQVSYKALDAGLDMDMVSEAFSSNIKTGLEKGVISPKRLDEACRKILEAKYKLGLFEDPYKFCRRNPENPDSLIYSDAHRKEARRVASESFVLLKNESVLPLKKQGTIAVIGPLADTRENMAGTWSVAARLGECRSVLDGIRSATEGKAKVLYAKGSNLVADEQLEQRATTFGRAIPRDGRSDQALLREAVSIASRADVIVAALGEASEMSGESSSRSDISIPDVQVKLLEELAKCGKPLVLVLFNGRPLTIEKETAQVPALLDVWFGGSESGDAIADVLFGDVNPSGKLTMSFPKNVGQIPIYYSHKNTGRPLAEGQWFRKFRSNYLDVDNDPLFPFGFGLSYTRFEYSPVQLSTEKLSQNGTLTASVTLSNTGDYDGKEIVQLYVRDLVGSVTRPVKELKGFRKVFLKAGENTTVNFDLDASELGFYDAEGKYIVEPGEFELFIGPSSKTDNVAKFCLE